MTDKHQPCNATWRSYTCSGNHLSTWHQALDKNRELLAQWCDDSEGAKPHEPQPSRGFTPAYSEAMAQISQGLDEEPQPSREHRGECVQRFSHYGTCSRGTKGCAEDLSQPSFEPSAEALQLAEGYIGKDAANGYTDARDLAVMLDAFRRAGVEAERERIRELEDAATELRKALCCSDVHCEMYRPPGGGIGTNGGCRCLRPANLPGDVRAARRKHLLQVIETLKPRGAK